MVYNMVQENLCHVKGLDKPPRRAAVFHRAPESLSRSSRRFDMLHATAVGSFLREEYAVMALTEKGVAG
jgi:hypothetical protein